MLISDAFKIWSEEIRPAIVAQYGENDTPALAESWNDYTDSELSGLSRQYCPAHDDPMPLDLGDELELILDGLGLTIKSVFVPFSQSRNRAEKSPSLNWSVTLKRNGRDVLTTDYSAGMGHCPSYHKKPPQGFDRPARMRQPLACGFECEEGFELTVAPWGWSANKKKPIAPDRLNAIHSLIMDSSVLDTSGFEEWASDLGYDTDSRTAETVYRACIEIALKLRAGIGNDTLEKLRELFSDY